jgi:pimeloyl-ACP methyl ester carboxylesterase
MAPVVMSPTAAAPARAVEIPCDGILLQGVLRGSNARHGLILFAHGSGSGRLSPRNTCVALELQAAGFATLLFDLLTQSEEVIDTQTARLRFDIPLLTQRLIAVSRWVLGQPLLSELPIGYFGASTGAAAALAAAANLPDLVEAVVSRGGRPDLAGELLGRVRAPTLLIVGGNDPQVLALNREARAQLHCEARLTVVPGATHLFEEPGKLEEVARLAADWFGQHLQPRVARAPGSGNNPLDRLHRES